jgi:predicted nucleotidyltransferase
MADHRTLELECMNAIAAVLEEVSSVQKAVLFGSWAKGVATPRSDVDIALYGDVGVLETEEIAYRLDELPFIQKFDVVAFNSVENVELREHIERVGVEIFTREVPQCH